jgi:uncharacterized HhH-GPD family protein
MNPHLVDDPEVWRMGDDPLIDAIADAVERTPAVLVLRVHLAQLLFDRCRYAETLIHCGTALLQDPVNPSALQLLQRCTTALTSQARWDEVKRTSGDGAPWPGPQPARSDRSPTLLGEGRHSYGTPPMPGSAATDDKEAAERHGAVLPPRGNRVDPAEAKPYDPDSLPGAPGGEGRHASEALSSLVDPKVTIGQSRKEATRTGGAAAYLHEVGKPSVEQPCTDCPTSRGASAGRAGVVAALVDFTESDLNDFQVGAPSFTTSPQADQLVLDNPFGFLVGVLFDQNLPADRAWRTPCDLRARLGHLDPHRIVHDPEAVRRAIGTPPKLHRYVDAMSAWVESAALIVCDEYQGDASAIWCGTPTAREVQDRLRKLPGIGEHKAAMAVQILGRDYGVPIRDIPGSDLAYNVHVRRVMLRTKLALVDELDHMLTVASGAGAAGCAEIDLAAWKIGRTWCRAGIPLCESCPLTAVCPKDIAAAPGSTVAPNVWPTNGMSA